MPDPIRDDAQARLSRACSELPDVRLAYLFGSRAKGRARKESDFDIGVLVDDERAAAPNRSATLWRIIGRLGQEVAAERVDLVLLNDAPALLRHRVLRDGIRLFQRSEEERVRFTVKTIRDYQDGAFRRDEFTRRRIERLRKEKFDGRSGDILEKARRAARLLGKAQGVSKR